MVITWPPTLPQNPQTVEVARMDARLRTKMDTGPAKMRARFTAVPTIYRCTNTLTPTQYQAFSEFYINTTSEGTEEFRYPTVTGTSGYETFRFETVPSFSSDNKNAWKVSFSLEQMP